MCTSAAPASKASCADSICSAGVMGTAGLFAFCGSEPVMATVTMQGVGTTHALPQAWSPCLLASMGLLLLDTVACRADLGRRHRCGREENLMHLLDSKTWTGKIFLDGWHKS